MATRGVKPRPEFVRYYEAGRDPVIYLVEAGQQVKVGMAAVAVCRLKKLHAELQWQGLSLGRFAVFPQSNRRVLWGAELRCIRALRAEAENTEGRREYFTGISYDDALAIVTKTLGAA